MVRTCIVPKCTERFKKNSAVTFHTFPIQPVMRKKWIDCIEAIKMEKYAPSKLSSICSKHFDEHCFIQNTQMRRILKKDAVPTIFKTSVHALKTEIDIQLASPSQLEGIEPVPSTSIPVMSSPQKLIRQNGSESSPEDPLISAYELQKKSKLQHIDYLEKGDSSKLSLSLELGEVSNIAPISSSSTSTASETECEVKRLSNVIPVGCSRTSSTATASEAEIELSRISSAIIRSDSSKNTSSQKRSTPSYIDDCLSDDMNSLRNARKNWILVQGLIEKQRLSIKTRLQQQRRLKARITTLNSLREKLKQKI